MCSRSTCRESFLERHPESVGTEARSGRAETAPKLNSVESIVIRMPVDVVGESGSDDGSSSAKRKVSWAPTVSYRAIPAVGNGKPVTRKRRTMWHGSATLLSETTEVVSNPSAGSQGGGVRGGAGAGSSIPGGAARTRWADATDEEFGP